VDLNKVLFFVKNYILRKIFVIGIRNFFVYLKSWFIIFKYFVNLSNMVENFKIFPEEKFSILQASTNDGMPVIGSFNLAYKNYEQKYKFPWCLKIGIALNLENVTENGLPKGDEDFIARKVESDLLEKIKQITTAHYIGHLFNDSFLDVYIYLDEPQKVHEYLQTQIDKENLERGFGYEIKKELDWTTVNMFLNL